MTSSVCSLTVFLEFIYISIICIFYLPLKIDETNYFFLNHVLPLCSEFVIVDARDKHDRGGFGCNKLKVADIIGSSSSAKYEKACITIRNMTFTNSLVTIKEFVIVNIVLKKQIVCNKFN